MNIEKEFHDLEIVYYSHNLPVGSSSILIDNLGAGASASSSFPFVPAIESVSAVPWILASRPLGKRPLDCALVISLDYPIFGLPEYRYGSKDK